ncbi:MAG: pyrimidine 5'-nucleotidase [Bauldia sp.]
MTPAGAAETGAANGQERPTLGRFGNIRAWVFDLDNTLYHAANAVLPQVEVRMRDYIARRLGVTPERAELLREDFYDRYGATLAGLVAEHRIEPDEFLAYVHDIDHSSLQPDPALAAAIAALPGKRFILTNGPMKHAETVAAALGVGESFHDIFDIAWAGYLPKPSPETYRRLLKRTRIAATKTAIFDDLTRNLLVPRQLGMATTLVVPSHTAPVFAAESAEFDFVTDDLPQFLRGVSAALRAPPPR